ncbi:hypothetical protein HNO88_004355 [Novosphingobium chloroacetimidivorans]|uniref:Uncharacterized protein n=1 Tax=Novosphingobium chloroacetimidivorans TaxID=1428314 RepID=A0A7W7KEZ0_9SPHN|nr:hypothetical protein [Novosphingobium chloroacetimidivorans]
MRLHGCNPLMIRATARIAQILRELHRC